MVRARVDRYVGGIRERLRTAFDEAHTPRQVAGSFAIGTFITMLPTLGTGLLLFVVLASVFDSISKIALFASVLVFNPLVKWGVYAASFALGVFVLGPVDGAATEISLTASPAIATRLLVGNLILAVVAVIPSYVIVYRLTVRYRASEVGEIIDDAAEEVLEASLPQDS